MEVQAPILWLLVAVLGLAVVFAVFAFKRGWAFKTDYRAFFWMGLAFLGISLGYGFLPDREVPITFLIMGIVYVAIGLANRDKWGQQEPLTPQRRRLMAALIAGVFAVFAMVVLAYFLT